MWNILLDTKCGSQLAITGDCSFISVPTLMFKGELRVIHVMIVVFEGGFREVHLIDIIYKKSGKVGSTYHLSLPIVPRVKLSSLVIW